MGLFQKRELARDYHNWGSGAMLDAEVEAIIQLKYEQLSPYLNETSMRMWAAVEALSLGHGGITRISRATGLSRTTIHAGISELEQAKSEDFDVEAYGAVRLKGGDATPSLRSIPDCWKNWNDSLTLTVVETHSHPCDRPPKVQQN